MFVSGETLDALENNGGLLWHAHLSRGNDDRRMPVPGVDDEQCKLWASAFKKGGYDARLSLEGNFAPYDSQNQDMKRVIKYLSEISTIDSLKQEDIDNSYQAVETKREKAKFGILD